MKRMMIKMVCDLNIGFPCDPPPAIFYEQVTNWECKQGFQIKIPIMYF